MKSIAPSDETLRDRLVLALSLAASLSYFLFSVLTLPPPVEIAWKGAGVGLLALYAALRAVGRDGWLLAGVMALGATADMVLELNLLAGGALFALGHVVAVLLYLRNLRAERSVSQVCAAAALLIGTPVVAGLLTAPQPGWRMAAAYALFVGAMAASAWVSRFPRYRTGLGAVLFVVSDLFIFARESHSVPESVTLWLIWPLYYIGQFLIATSVSRALRQRAAA